MNGGKARRGAMWALVSGVAAIAAIVSQSHIYDLGRAHGGSGVAARLLPLSVDMLILVGELMLLHEADAKGRRFGLRWLLVWSGIPATLAANVAYGAQFGVLGALIWGWPAYSFILARAAWWPSSSGPPWPGKTPGRQVTGPLSALPPWPMTAARFRRLSRPTPKVRRWPRCGPRSPRQPAVTEPARRQVPANPGAGSQSAPGRHRAGKRPLRI